MKKLLLILAGVAAVAVVVVLAAPPPYDDNAGHHIPGNAIIGGTLTVGGVQITATNSGTSAVLSNKMATAAVLATTSKAASTAGAVTVLTKSITYQGVDGSTNTLNVVTNVTINAVYGFASDTSVVLTGATVAAVSAATNVVVGTVISPAP